MVFANLIFLFAFLPLNILLYYVSGNRNWRNLVLVAFSMFFYAWGEPVWIALLLFSALVDYTNARFIERFRGTGWAKFFLCLSLCINLGLLGLFKYSGFLVENINALLGLSLAVPAFSLPIGISFYTFQTVSYVVDVYRGQVEAQKSYPRYLMYLSLYFQLVAGPIVRYSDVQTEIESRRTSAADVSAGITRFCTGLGKKVLIANVAGSFVAQYMDGDLTKLSLAGAWFGAIMYAVQIYYDFSGYSDMAIGLGLIFGFHFRENFDYPYVSRSITEFWRRWHISLSSFFRDYLYIPLGGNRSHAFRNLFIVWFCTGLWHGASWNFILWGLGFGCFILMERLFLKNWLEKLPRFLTHLYTMTVVIFSWVVFYFTDLSRLGAYLKAMVGVGVTGLTDVSTNILLMNNCFWIAFALIFCLPFLQVFKCMFGQFSDRLQKFLLWLQPVYNLAILVMSASLLVGESYNPFLYFRF